MNAVEYSERYTLEQLVQLEKDACEYRNLKHTKHNCKKVDDIRWAIYYKQCEKRIAAGGPISTGGYSGRQSKRR